MMEIFLIGLYVILGFGYMYFKVLKELMPEFWSPIQPLAMVIVWPLIAMADLVRWINKNSGKRSS